MCVILLAFGWQLSCWQLRFPNKIDSKAMACILFRQPLHRNLLPNIKNPRTRCFCRLFHYVNVWNRCSLVVGNTSVWHGWHHTKNRQKFGRSKCIRISCEGAMSYYVGGCQQPALLFPAGLSELKGGCSRGGSGQGAQPLVWLGWPSCVMVTAD